MGITMGLMKQLRERNVLSRSGLKVLDIGSSNLYQARAQEITDYVMAFGGKESPAALQEFSYRLAKGSAYDPVKGGINESFAGELIERCGMSYLSMYIAKGYKTEVFDLNHEDLPPQHRGAYDVVMNIVTTEHVFNQYNSFKVLTRQRMSAVTWCINCRLPVVSTTAERQLSLEMENVEGLPLVSGDPALLLKVFQNLVSNAIKYTPDGGRITLRGGRVMDARLGDCVEVQVQDTGIGIDPDHQELIFEKFYQTGRVSLHSTSETSFMGGGTGLGLSIVRGIVNAHGGHIWVESPGHHQVDCPGSTFFVRLPLGEK